MDLSPFHSKLARLMWQYFGLWAASWAIRKQWKLDYTLSGAAKLVRWTIVFVGFGLAASLPGASLASAVAGLIGLWYLCWPNYAYYLTRPLHAWPTTDAVVVSHTDFGNRWAIGYSFQV